MSQADLAKEVGLSAPAITNVLQGTRKVSVQEAGHIAYALNQPINKVLNALGVDQREPKWKIRGFIAADDLATIDNVVLYDEHEHGLEEIDPPFPGYTGVIVRVRGNSMAGRYRHGELVGFKPGNGEFKHLVGREAVVRLPDGRLVLKILHRGSRPDCYTLTSLNPQVDPIVDTPVEWVAKIDVHIPD